MQGLYDVGAITEEGVTCVIFFFAFCVKQDKACWNAEEVHSGAPISCAFLEFVKGTTKVFDIWCTHSVLVQVTAHGDHGVDALLLTLPNECKKILDEEGVLGLQAMRMPGQKETMGHPVLVLTVL